MKKPIIGITLDLAEDNEKYSYSKYPWYVLRKDYSDCVADAGGLSMMIPYSKDIDAILDIIDGLIISGGDEDVDPAFYDQEIISNKVKINTKRCNFEMELVKAAMERNMPIFGICNGLQVINVALGGCLIQHIPDHHDSDINHEQPDPKKEPTHPIHVEPNTLLAELAHAKEIMVNTTHHQAINKVGSNLIVSAKAPDGIIEAIESTTHKFVIGVQWHSEYLNSQLDYNLFKRFVEECSNSR
jgi:putative glutamine amidotransferase